HSLQTSICGRSTSFDLDGHRGSLHLLALEAENLVNEDDGDAAGHDLAVDDEDLVNAAVHTIRRLGAGILEREDVLVDAAETLLEVGHDLLRPHDEDESLRTGAVGAERAATKRGREQRSTLGDRMHAAEHDVGRGGEAADLVGLCLAIHAPDSWPERLVATGVLNLFGDARLLERLRATVVNLGSVGDKTQHDPFGFCDVRRPEDANSVCFEGGRGAPHAGVVRQSPEPTSDRPIQVRVQFGGHSLPSPLFWWNNLQVQVPYILESCIRLRMQVRSKPDVKAVFDRLTAKELPGRRGLEAWRSLLRAHATLIRPLATGLEQKAG